MHQNALGQPDCMFLISTTSPEKNDEMSFIILIQIQEKQKLVTIFFLAWHDQKKGVVTPKLAMFQEAMDRINIFLYGDANSGKQSF